MFSSSSGSSSTKGSMISIASSTMFLLSTKSLKYASISGAYFWIIGVIFECTQFPGTSGDHAPIHHAQLEHDQPFYATIWKSSNCLDRIVIDYDNWKKVPSIWNRRFKEN